MFSWIKRNRFNNKVNEFREMITNICTEEYRKNGIIDEMYTISICKFDGRSLIADAKLEEDGGITIKFKEGIIYDVGYVVKFSNNGTMVSYVSKSDNLELLEFDVNNEEMLFSMYIDLFLDIYIYDAHKKMLEDLEIDFSNQPAIFRDIVKYIQENANTYEFKNISSVYYLVENDDGEYFEFYICLNREKGLLEIRFDIHYIEDDIEGFSNVINVAVHDYKNRITQVKLAENPVLEFDDVKEANSLINGLYEEFIRNEKKYLDGELML